MKYKYKEINVSKENGRFVLEFYSAGKLKYKAKLTKKQFQRLIDVIEEGKVGKVNSMQINVIGKLFNIRVVKKKLQMSMMFPTRKTLRYLKYSMEVLS